ncbi:hypothetical protein PbB2_03004 [Candidatus Phycosocius bacilliformis]|uniref:Uncharacterized protein n=1 Tax=Candidatus Phycosocius bacilliformis TaxID=1445552 RepID=A0A2P2EE17_9PROT|nr:hypothetical protein PbB2_03004 [Candidatus Phycosocius bacilliformis]
MYYRNVVKFCYPCSIKSKTELLDYMVRDPAP